MAVREFLKAFVCTAAAILRASICSFLLATIQLIADASVKPDARIMLTRIQFRGVAAVSSSGICPGG
jgi:uncharacterized protein (DUF1778 family)